MISKVIETMNKKAKQAPIALGVSQKSLTEIVGPQNNTKINKLMH